MELSDITPDITPDDLATACHRLAAAATQAFEENGQAHFKQLNDVLLWAAADTHFLNELMGLPAEISTVALQIAEERKP